MAMRPPYQMQRSARRESAADGRPNYRVRYRDKWTCDKGFGLFITVHTDLEAFSFFSIDL